MVGTAQARLCLPLRIRCYGRFFSVAAAGVAAGGAAGALALARPNNRRVGVLSGLFTARLMSPSVRRAPGINKPERVSKYSATSPSDFTPREQSPPFLSAAHL